MLRAPQGQRRRNSLLRRYRADLARAAERRYPLNSIRLHLRFGVLLIAGCVVSWLLMRP